MVTNGRDRQIVGPFYSEMEAVEKLRSWNIDTQTSEGVKGILPHEVLPLYPTFLPWIPEDNEPEAA